MIVVDTNVIAYLLIHSEYSKYAEYLLRYEPDWAAPLLWRSEFRNILVLYLRKKILDITQVQNIMTTAEELMAQNEFSVSSLEVLQAVQNSKCSAYDCEFVCLAQSLNTLLVTEDKKILQNFPEVAKSLVTFDTASSLI